MKSFKSIFQSSGSFYIISSTTKNFIKVFTGIILIQWIDPTSLGYWQSYLLLISYSSLLNIGVSTGVRRQLPYLLGKGDNEYGKRLVESANIYVVLSSLTIILIVCSCTFLLIVLDRFELSLFPYLLIALLYTITRFQIDLIEVTFRSSKSFAKLAKLQLLISTLHILLLPLVKFYSINGYMMYLIIIELTTLISFIFSMPFKIRWRYDIIELKELIRIGFPVFVINYINIQIQNAPKLILLVAGSPYMVGLFAPAYSIRTGILNISKSVNRYLFPQMSHKLGKTNNSKVLYQYAVKSFIPLLIAYIVVGIVAFIILDPFFKEFYPEYISALGPTQYFLLSSVFLGSGMVLHNALIANNSVKLLIIMMLFKLLSLGIGTYFISFYSEMLWAVSLGALLSEFLSMIVYILLLKNIIE